MGTMSVPSRTFSLILEVANGNIWVFGQKRPELKENLTMTTALRVSFCFFRDACIYGAKFQEHCSNISRDIIYLVSYHFQLQKNIDIMICIYNKNTPGQYL